MLTIASDVLFLAEKREEFADKNSGEIREMYRASFLQDGSSVVEMAIDKDIYGCMEKLRSYSLDIEISTFNNKFRCKVVGYAECA